VAFVDAMPRRGKRTTGSREVTGSGSSSRVLPFPNIKYRKDDIADDKEREEDHWQ
jgi:hypothetical protein